MALKKSLLRFLNVTWTLKKIKSDPTTPFLFNEANVVGSEERRGRNGREEGKEEICLGVRIVQQSRMKLESLL